MQDAALFQRKSLSLAGNKFATLEDLDPLVRPLSTCTAPCALHQALAHSTNKGVLRSAPMRSDPDVR